jgi:hypothetical protein
LELLGITGAIITIDAMGTQTEIAKKIIGNKADYILALKANIKNPTMPKGYGSYTATTLSPLSTPQHLSHFRIFFASAAL